MIDLGVLLQIIGIVIWLSIMAPVVVLGSRNIFIFLTFHCVMADNGYEPRAQAMEEIHFDWRCIVCCMVALSPLHLEQQLPGTESVYSDIDSTPWVKHN